MNFITNNYKQMHTSIIIYENKRINNILVLYRGLRIIIKNRVFFHFKKQFKLNQILFPFDIVHISNNKKKNYMYCVG